MFLKLTSLTMEEFMSVALTIQLEFCARRYYDLWCSFDKIVHK